MSAGAPLLGRDDRSQDAVDRLVELAHHRVMLAQARAVDPHHHLGTRGVERLPLQALDRLAPDLAVEVAGSRPALVTGEGGLVGGAAGADHESTAPRRARGPERKRLGGAADDDPGGHPAGDLHLAVEEHRPLGVRVGARVGDELKRFARQAEPQLAVGVLEHRPQLDELRDERAKPSRRRQPPERERHADARAGSVHT